MEAKNMDSMSETDNIIEKYLSGEISYCGILNELWPQVEEGTERIWKLLNTGYHYCEYEPILKSWLEQWCKNPEYNVYNANDVELFIKGTGLFLIPTANGKPIKLIIA